MICGKTTVNASNNPVALVPMSWGLLLVCLLRTQVSHSHITGQLSLIPIIALRRGGLGRIPFWFRIGGMSTAIFQNISCSRFVPFLPAGLAKLHPTISRPVLPPPNRPFAKLPLTARPAYYTGDTTPAQPHPESAREPSSSSQSTDSSSGRTC